MTNWFRFLAALAFVAVVATIHSGAAHAQRITIVAGGDIEWDLDLRPFTAYPQEQDGWRTIPYLLTQERRAYLRENDPELLARLDRHYNDAIHYGLEFDDIVEQVRYPFHGIAPIFRAADIGFTNLETALSDTARRPYPNALRTPAAFADAIRWAGIDFVSTANNHAFDAEGEGVLHTIENLRRAGVAFAGTGRNLDEARRPYVFVKNGISVGFLAYTQFVNRFGPFGFAGPDLSGAAPMDPYLVLEDIARLRDQVDYVVLSFHWDVGGQNNSSTIVEPNPRAIELAHKFIDAGADIILGHHPPLPRGVEVYNGGLIFYSLGKLIFGHNHHEWTDNILARITLEPDRIVGVEILPVAGEGMDMSQPYPLSGERAQRLLRIVQERTERLGTRMEIEGDIGYIRLVERAAARP